MQGRLSVAGVLAVAGALTLLVGLSLDWYEPRISAWTAFEVVDLLLAAIAIGVVAVALARSPSRPWLEAAARWLPVAALAALVLVIAALVNPPPGAIDRSVEIGAWISLAGAILLVIAATLATTEVSLVVAMRPRRGDRPAADDETQAITDEGDWVTAPGEDPAAFGGAPVDEAPLEDAGIEPDPVQATDEEILEADEELFPIEEPVEEAEEEAETRPLRRRRS